MKHDLDLAKHSFNKELLELGEDKIVYFSKLDPKQAEQLGFTANSFAPDIELWGVYSAGGGILAVCDSVRSAWEFANDQDFITVRTH